MSIDPPLVIDDTCLSRAWAQIFLRVAPHGTNLRDPIMVTIQCIDQQEPSEDAAIRDTLDDHLITLGKTRIDATALTIFPYKPWIRRDKPAYAEFRKFCIARLLPRLKSLDARNRNGTYFERMMAYTGLRHDESREVDQLDFIINLLLGDRRSRESALQVACFDPAKDHTGQPVRGFPCLQQVGVTYGEDETIAVNAFYPTQYIFDRAYGNYLGLCHLGYFLAHETNLRFARLNCFIGKPEFGGVNKGDVDRLIAACRSALEPASTGGDNAIH